jgi:glycosyltransferase involved in cell wall biosynthesis
MASIPLSRWADYPAPDNLPPAPIADAALPLVSVVTPSYNQGRYIRATIESVLSQDYPNLEYWVIDGGSTDETLDILREYAGDPRLHWLSESDHGQSDAINKGWSRCRGDILAWLNSDDLYLPGAIRSQVAFLQAHPSVDAVYGNAQTIDEQGREVGVIWGRPFSQYELARLCYIPQPATFLRRRLIEQTGPVDTELHYTMDYDYWLRASLWGVFAYHPSAIAAFRFHDSSKTVATIASFAPESEQVVKRFVAQDAVSVQVARRRNRILADLMLRLSVQSARAGDTRHAFSYLRRSFAYHLFRPRLLWALVALIDAAGGWSVSRNLSELWNCTRAKEAQ